MYVSAALACLLVVSWVVVVTVLRSEFWDFNVFYSSARAALQGESFYRTYGTGHLPYWYFPWVAWAFIPLAALPFEVAKIVYVVVTLIAAVWVIYTLGHHFDEKISPVTLTYALAIALLMCWLLFRTGQMDFILLAAVVALILLIDNGHSGWAGLLFPLLLFKPHLLAVFIPFVLIRGGKKFLLSAALSVIILGAVAFVFIPNWPLEMLRMLGQYGQRTDNPGILPLSQSSSAEGELVRDSKSMDYRKRIHRGPAGAWKSQAPPNGRFPVLYACGLHALRAARLLIQLSFPCASPSLDFERQ